jgi:hypothetical protein
MHTWNKLFKEDYDCISETNKCYHYIMAIDTGNKLVWAYNDNFSVTNPL